LISHLQSAPAPFYILHFPLTGIFSGEKFWPQLVSQALSIKTQAPLDHPDVLWLTPDKGRYQQEHIEKFRRFTSLAPHECSRKLVIWHEANLIPLLHINKLLKDLETSSGNFTVLMTNTAQAHLPSTLTSRAITWRLKLDDQYLEKEDNQLIAELLLQFKDESLSPTGFAQQYSSKADIHSQLWQYVLKQNKLGTRPYSYLNGLWKSFKNYERHSKWNHLRKDTLIELGLYLKELSKQAS